MLGALIGDFAGSRFEWNDTNAKEFDLLTFGCRKNDDIIKEKDNPLR